MTELRCTVQTCAHNQDDYCALDRITVSGKRAAKAAETSCDSFQMRKDGQPVNAAKEASPVSEISCEAMDCKYNEGCTCHAGTISVEGGNACRCGQTECATFCKTGE